jgi:methyl-accepting chemotaxis protein
VADEVRKLAEKSSKAAQEIDNVTRTLEEQSQRVKKAILQGEDSLQITHTHMANIMAVVAEASDAVTRTNQGVDAIGMSVTEQSNATNEIARQVESIAEVTERNSGASRDNDGAAARLAKLASDLKGAVGQFKVLDMART